QNLVCHPAAIERRWSIALRRDGHASAAANVQAQVFARLDHCACPRCGTAGRLAASLGIDCPHCPARILRKRNVAHRQNAGAPQQHEQWSLATGHLPQAFLVRLSMASIFPRARMKIFACPLKKTETVFPQIMKFMNYRIFRLLNAAITASEPGPYPKVLSL